jgi:flagellar motor switch protein FliG
MALAALQLVTSLDQLTGSQRAAVLIMYLDPEVSRSTLAFLNPDELRDIGFAMADVENVSPEAIEQVIAEFVRDLYSVSLVPRTGREYALEILPDLIPEEARTQVVSRLRRTISTEFEDFISRRIPFTVATLLLDEHPQTQSVALMLMGTENAATVLSYFDEQEQFDLAIRMAKMDQVPGELADDVENAITIALEDRGSGLWDAKGIDSTARVLGRLNKEFQEPLMERITALDPELAELLKRRMLLFSDLGALNNKAVQSLLKSVDRDTLLLAIRGADPALAELFFSNMSRRAAADLKDELEIMGAVPRTEVEKAQEDIVQTALSLQEEGVLRLPTGGAEDEMV